MRNSKWGYFFAGALVALVSAAATGAPISVPRPATAPAN